MESSKTRINLPESELPRVVIVGGGFAGLKMARGISRKHYQVVLIDRNNFHQFQPLFYQVAMAGLEPSSIVFPFRKLFHGEENIYVRVTEVQEVDLEEKRLNTPLGICNYDHLIIATGANTNYFGNKLIQAKSLPMKSVSEALFLRNTILDDYETAVSTPDYDDRQELVDIVIVGGGPTGVELAGALAEMRKTVLPKDYPELNVEAEMDIYLVQAGDILLAGMSEKSGRKAEKYLQDLGVRVLLNTRVTNFDGELVTMEDGSTIPTNKVIWAAGVTGELFKGLPEDAIVRGNRLQTDAYHQVAGVDGLYAIGDIACLPTEDWPNGHPQVAQTAIQMGRNLSKNFNRLARGKDLKPFTYKDKGSMATIGRAKAVVDLPSFHFSGFFAWLAWLVVHLFAILGTKNKFFVFINWLTNYINYNQSLRLIIKPKSNEP
ncbi:MAG: NAD(P)/FAD-dependent oxidoreductase [Bacteroidota bacterium]